MGPDRDTLKMVAENTEVLRPPRQSLATFGTTSIEYFLVTEPSYADLMKQELRETVIRTGQVIAERPQLVTPYYLLNLFTGFEHGSEFAEYLASTYGPQSPGLLYSYRNELKDTSVVSDPLPVVIGRLNDQLDERGEGRTAIVRGVDHLWDISIMKFIFDLTINSLGQNVQEMASHGLLQMSGGVPRGARERISSMFEAVRAGELAASELKSELDRWGLFEEYEDRFFDLFRRR